MSAGPAQTVCANNATVVLAGSISGGSITGIWISSGTGTFLPNNASLRGTYLPSNADKLAGGVTLTLRSTNNQACTVVGSSFRLTITPAPVVDAGEDQEVCSNDANVYLKGKVTTASGGLWVTNGDGSFMPSNTALDAYYVPGSKDVSKGSVKLSLQSTGNGNCIAVSDEMDVKIIPPPVIDKMPLMYIFEGESVQLKPTVRGAELQYQWLPDKYLSSNKIQNPLAKGVEDQIYTLTVTGTGECVAQEQLMIKVLKPIIIPNTFTPNGDGINDVWVIKELLRPGSCPTNRKPS